MIAMTLRKTIDVLRGAVAELDALDLGYPKSSNCVFSPEETSSAPQRWLQNHHPDVAQFFTCCGGVSLPDVRNGYFIHRPGHIVRDGRVQWSGSQNGEGVIFGSSGGGDLFVVGNDSVVVRLRETPRNGTCFRTTADNSRVLAANVEDFVQKLIMDLKAFCSDDPQHDYLV